MSCESNLSKESLALLFKIRAEHFKNKTFEPTNNNLLTLINRTSVLPSPRRSEVDEIIQPFLNAILDYDSGFNETWSEANALVDKVADQNSLAIRLFERCLDELSTNLERIQAIGEKSEEDLIALRGKINQDLRNLTVQLQNAEAKKVETEAEIKLLQKEIQEIEQRLQSLEVSYWKCVATTIFVGICKSIVDTIHVVTREQQIKKSDLRGKTSELTKLNNQLATINQEKKSLEADYNASSQILVEITSTRHRNDILLNDIKAIKEQVQGKDLDIPAFILRKELEALQSDWNDLVDSAKLNKSALQLN